MILVIATLCRSWLFSTLVYELHYAHLFYAQLPRRRQRWRLLSWNGGAGLLGLRALLVMIYHEFSDL